MPTTKSKSKRQQQQYQDQQDGEPDMDRSIIGKKRHSLIAKVQLDKEEIDYFFEKDLLPRKRRIQIRELEVAPNARSTTDFINLLEEFGQRGSVETLAEILENKNSALGDELWAELDFEKGKLHMDEATIGETATMIHKAIGHSKKLGPVDQKILSVMLGGQVVTIREGALKQLARVDKENQKVMDIGEEKETRLRHIAEVMDDTIMNNNLRIPSPQQHTNKESRAVFQVDNLVEELFSSIIKDLEEMEKIKEEKAKTKDLIEKKIGTVLSENDPLEPEIMRIVDKQLSEHNMLMSRLRTADDKVEHLKDSIVKATKERPIKVKVKVESREKLRERIMNYEAQNSELREREAKLSNIWSSIMLEMEKLKTKYGVVVKSRTVKKEHLGMNIENDDHLMFSMNDFQSRGGKGRSSGSPSDSWMNYNSEIRGRGIYHNNRNLSNNHNQLQRNNRNESNNRNRSNNSHYSNFNNSFSNNNRRYSQNSPAHSDFDHERRENGYRR